MVDDSTNPPLILITGSSGFIGTNSMEYFRQRGYRVAGLDVVPPPDLSQLPSWHQCSLLNSAALRKLVHKCRPDYVLHLAARTDLREKKNLQSYSVNTEGTENLLEVLAHCSSVRRVIFASSRMVCSIGYQPKNHEDYNPPNLYGESKVRMEQLIRAGGIGYEWLIVRPTSIWGPWFDAPYRDFFRTIQTNNYYHPTHCDPFKSFGYVGNTVYQLKCLLEAPAADVHRATTYLCDYPPLRLFDWANLIQQQFGARPIRHIPLSALRAVAHLGDSLQFMGWHRVPLTTFRLRNLTTEMVYECDLLHRLCGQLPYSLDEGIAATVSWMKAASGR